jgi:lipopolysaccharide export LptBFGC system permease protein LptF
MWRLHRYYLKELTVNAVITFLVLFAVMLVSLTYRGLQSAQGGQLIDVALIMIYYALDSVQHLLTIAFLLATVMTFTRAAQDRELIAIRAAGIPPRVPMMAATLVGILLAVVGSLSVHYLIPEVHYRKYRVIATVVRNTFMNLRLGTDRIKVPFSDFVLTFRSRRGNEYLDCTIYTPKALGDDGSPIWFAERVTTSDLAQTESEPWSVVLEGVREPLGGSRPNRLEFRVSLHDLANRERRNDNDADLRSDQLLAEVMRGVHRAPHEAIYALFRRCCFALMPVLLAPIGYCLAELARERGRVFALVLAMLPLMAFYAGEVLGARLLVTTHNPWVAWMPAVLLLGFGVPLCWRQLRR